MSIYRCNVRDYTLEVAKFQEAKNKAHVNAFSNIVILVPPKDRWRIYLNFTPNSAQAVPRFL